MAHDEVVHLLVQVPISSSALRLSGSDSPARGSLASCVRLIMLMGAGWPARQEAEVEQDEG
jgi:hypothetical protein